MNELFDVLNEHGEYIGEVASRELAHAKGLWHKAVVVFIINSKQEILLQKRSATKKLWPNLWDITAGGHVLSGEFGYQAAIREAKEEIGITISLADLTFIGSTISHVVKGDMIDNHFNEFYIVHQDVDLESIILQEEEVQDVRWFSKEEFLTRFHQECDGLTEKIGCWNYLEKYFEFQSSSNF